MFVISSLSFFMIYHNDKKIHTNLCPQIISQNQRSKINFLKTPRSPPSPKKIIPPRFTVAPPRKPLNLTALPRAYSYAPIYTYTSLARVRIVRGGIQLGIFNYLLNHTNTCYFPLYTRLLRAVSLKKKKTANARKRGYASL